MFFAWIATIILCLVPLVYILGAFYMIIVPEKDSYGSRDILGMIVLTFGVFLIPVLLVICGAVVELVLAAY